MANVDTFVGLQKQISNTMNLINSSYFNSSLISPFLGNAQLIGTAAPFTTNYSAMITQADNSVVQCPANSGYLNKMFAQLVKDTFPFGRPSTSQSIYTFQLNGSAYQAATINSFATPFTSNSCNLTTGSGCMRDINCMARYIGSTTIPAGARLNVFQFMQALYAWYGLLDGNNWKAFCNGQQVTFKIPDSTDGRSISNVQVVGLSTTSDFTLHSGNSLQTMLKTIMDYNLLIGLTAFQFNPFPAKRIIYSYIQLMQFQLAMGIYNVAMDGTDTNLQSGANGLLQSIAYILDNNNGSIVSASGGVNTLLMQNTRQRMQNYNNFVTNITSLDTTVTTGKYQLSTQQKKVAAQMNTTTIVRKFEIAAFIILMVVLFGAAISVFAPLPSTTKIASASFLVIISVIAAFIMHFVYRSKHISIIESFDASNASDIPSLMTGVRANDYVNVSNVLSIYYLNSLSNYYTNTMNLSNALQTYRTYADMNTSLQKEQQYYNDTNTQIVNATGKVKSVYKLSFSDQIRRTALMNFFMTMAIVSSATIAAYVAAKEYAPGIGAIVLVIGVTLIIGLFIIFLIELNSRVRTDGDKIYFGVIDSNYRNKL